MSTTVGKKMIPQLEYEKKRKRKIERLVFVLNGDGQILSPTNPVNANILLTRGHAVIHKYGTPYVIRMTDTLEDAVVRPIRLEVEMKQKTTIKVSAIFRVAKRTVIFPYYLPIERYMDVPSDTSDPLVRTEISGRGFELVMEFAKYAKVERVTVVYEDKENYDILDRIYDLLTKSTQNPDTVERRGYLKVSSWRERQKERRNAKAVAHQVAEKFFGFYAGMADCIDKKNPHWFFKLCREFVHLLYNPLMEKVSKVRMLPDAFRFASTEQRVKDVIRTFWKTDMEIKFLVRQGILELP